MKRYFPITIATFIWVWPAIIIRLLKPYFGNFTQNFYRYLAASLVLVILSLIFYRKEFFIALKNIRRFILPAIIIFVFQIFWVWSLFILPPAIATLINRSSVLFVALFSFLLFKDERHVIKSKAFVWGALLSIIGIIGVIAGKSNLPREGQMALETGNFNLGMIVVLTSAFLWAVYVLVIKRTVRKTEPLIAAGLIFTLSLPLFFVAALFFGDLKEVFYAPAGVNGLLFISGIFCVGVANAFNFKSIKIIGTAVSSTFVLVTPFFTAIVSYFVFREVLTGQQILFGLLLLTGCGILLRMRNNLPATKTSKKEL